MLDRSYTFCTSKHMIYILSTKISSKMPLYEWMQIDTGRGIDNFDASLDNIRSIAIDTSNKQRCQLCDTNVDNHEMDYKLYFCKSSMCHPTRQEEEISRSCKCWYKTLYCTTTQVYEVLKYDNHLSLSASPKQLFTRQMKRYVKELVLDGIAAEKTRNKCIKKINLDRSNIPPLKVFQNFVSNFKRSKGGVVEYVDEVERIANDHKYNEVTQVFCVCRQV